MPIDVLCPQCGQKLQARDEYAGQKVPCPSCGTPLQLEGTANPYASPGYQGPIGPLPDARTSGAAVASLILGALSLVFTILTGIPAIILGVIAQSSIGKSAGR